MFKIDENTLTKIINYLASKPYREVFELINELIRLETFKEIKQDSKENDN